MTHARSPWTRQLLAVWLLFGFFFSVQSWDQVRGNESTNPDNIARLHQIESLADGQGWFDLEIDRLGIDGVDMHWTRHVDAIATPVYLVVDAVASDQVARGAVLLAVPLLFLFVALWAVGATAAALSPHKAAPLFAMALFAATAGSFHLRPGRIDHHGFHIMLVMLILYFLHASSWKWSHAAAGAGVGLAVTSSLETLPILAAVYAGVGLLWLVGHNMERAKYVHVGLGTMAGWLIGGILFAPPSRLWSQECDVFSLGFVGLLSVPALGMAAVGGRDWTRPQRFVALGAIGAAALGWFALVSSECAGGPYHGLPQVIQDEWLLRIDEVRSLFDDFETGGLSTLATGLTFLAAVVILGVRSWRRHTFDHTIMLVVLTVASLLAIAQLRAVPMAQALAAPVTGGVVAALHHRVLADRAAWLYRILAVIAVAAFPLVAFVGVFGEQEPTCLASIDETLPAGVVVADMTFATEMLIKTDHKMLAGAYHRTWEGALATYDIFTAAPDAAQALVKENGVDYVAICTNERSFVQFWGESNPGSLSDRLNRGDVPSWLRPVTDEPALFYRVVD